MLSLVYQDKTATLTVLRAQRISHYYVRSDGKGRFQCECQCGMGLTTALRRLLGPMPDCPHITAVRASGESS